MKRAHLYVLSGLLAAIAAALFLYKVLIFGFPLKPEQRTDVWRVEVQIRFEADGGPAKAELYLPGRTDAFTVVDQSFVSPGYGITTERHPGRGMRAAFSIREARGTQTLYYRAVVQRGRANSATERDPQPEVTPPKREDAEQAAAQAIVKAALQQSADAATLAALLVKRLNQAMPGDEASFLLGPRPNSRRLASVAVGLLQTAGVPARVVNGLILVPERRDAQFVRWLEYYAGGRWRPHYPAEPTVEALRYYLPWWRGRGALVQLSGGTALDPRVSTNRSYELAIHTALTQQRELEKKLIEFSLFGLPLQVQALFRTLLVIPAGILLLVILRNIVGVKTFGTFMPVLIALSFRQTGLIWGLLFFSVVVALGLAVRFYLERLKLLLVPRVAAVVIVVILILAGLTVISFRLGLERGLSIGLFPIVILTFTIERMTLVWEERGPREALQQGLGSILVGALCYLVMSLRTVEHLLFVFPELLLAVLAITLLIGRYTGYRLTELRRFKVLAR
ncbi:MAG: UUP1 family membrane protein [Betaproteobacteria bacterium]|nr:UUP1 family membrane protein [Betaproteobacteria bacterium]